MLKEQLLANVDLLGQLVNDMYSFNGALNYLVMYENDEEFFDLFFRDKPMEAVRACYYGNYNYNDPYVKFNGYENLESYNETDYLDLLVSHIDDILDELQKCSEKDYILKDILFKLRQEEA